MYTITTYCYGKFDPLAPIWAEKIRKSCTKDEVIIHKTERSSLDLKDKYAWRDVVRLYENLKILEGTKKPVVQVDLDLIIEKDITTLVQLNHDIIISREIGLDKAFPAACAEKLGFGICSGFFVMKPSAALFLQNLLSLMRDRIYDTYSDQATLMHYIANNPHSVEDETVEIDGVNYTNKIIHIENITICVLDYNIIIRDPMFQLHQYGNHINVDNVGGVHSLAQYFTAPLESLPLTCRCGKRNLGDSSVCVHAPLRAKYATQRPDGHAYDSAGRIII